MITVQQIPDRFKRIINRIFEKKGVTPYSIEIASYGVVYPNLDLEGRSLGEPSASNGMAAFAEYRANPRGYARVALLVFNEYLTQKFFEDYKIPAELQNVPTIQKEISRKQSELTEQALVEMVPEFIGEDQGNLMNDETRATLEQTQAAMDKEKDVCPDCGEVHPPITPEDILKLVNLLKRKAGAKAEARAELDSFTKKNEWLN